MALNTVTLLTLIQKLAEANSDYLSFSTTTTVTTDNYVISTTLGQYDESVEDHFGGADTEWWLYFTEGANIGVNRRTSDYEAGTTRITVEGAALAAESAAVGCRLYRFNRDHMKNAIIEAGNEIYPALFLPLEDTTLITGNALPDASFESWSSASSLEWYTANAGVLAQQSAAGSTHNGSYAAKLTASGSVDYFYISSNSYRRLLDFDGQTVSFYVYAYPQDANDATMTVYTIDSAGSTQTLASTTACVKETWTMISLENQQLNDDLVEIQVRFGVTTDAKYVIFDDALLTGRRMYEYLLPNNFRDGDLDGVYMQTTGGDPDPACYAAHPFSTINPGVELPPITVNNGTQIYWRTDRTLPAERRLRLLGQKPLETLSADTDTITLDSWRVPLLIARARMVFWEREATHIGVQDKSRFEYEYNKAERDFRRALTRMRMPMPAKMREM